MLLRVLPIVRNLYLKNFHFCTDFASDYTSQIRFQCAWNGLISTNEMSREIRLTLVSVNDKSRLGLTTTQKISNEEGRMKEKSLSPSSLSSQYRNAASTLSAYFLDLTFSFIDDLLF